MPYRTPKARVEIFQIDGLPATMPSQSDYPSNRGKAPLSRQIFGGLGARPHI